MFGIGGSEIIIIAIVVLVLFGPDKLPQMARTVGRFMREFKRYQSMMEATFKAEMYMAENAAKPKVTDEDPFKKAREYREKAGVAAPGETLPVVAAADDDAAAETEVPMPNATEEGEEDEDAPIAPEDAGWVPGSADAPGMRPEDGEEAGAQPTL